MKKTKQYFIQFDVFSSPQLNDSREIRCEKRTNTIATRICLILVFLIMILVLSLPRHSEQIEIQSFSLAQYESFPSDALCPCTEYSLSYSTIFFQRPLLSSSMFECVYLR